MRPRYELHPLHNEITNLAWAWHGYCQCALVATVYRKANYKLKHYFTKGTWELKERARVVKCGTNDDLINEIKSI